MPNLINVQWHGCLEDDEPGTQLWQGEHVMSSWAASPLHANDAARTICEDYFDEETWEKHFGAEETCACVWITITAPVAIAGRYTIILRRIVKAIVEKREEAPYAIP